MDRRSVVLRAANPTFDEGLACARYLDQAAEGFFHLWLGPRAGDIIATAFLEPDHDLSYQRVTFAERDDVIVGMVCVYTAEQHRRSSSEPVHRAAGGRNLRTRAFFDSVETEKRGKALFEKAWPLREALDRNEKRSRAFLI